MNYKDQIFMLLCECTDTNFDAWVLTHEYTLERVTIMRKTQQIARETKGQVMPKRFEGLVDLDGFVDGYEEVSLFYKAEDDAFDQKIMEMESQGELKRIHDYRTFIIDSVLAKIPKI